MVLRPLGHTTQKAPHEKQLKLVGDGISKAIMSIHGKSYNSIPSVDLYPTSGSASDWFYGDEVAAAFGRHVYGYTIELRPSGNQGGNGFVLPPDQIIPVGEEIFAAMKYFVKAVSENPLD